MGEARKGRLGIDKGQQRGTEDSDMGEERKRS